MKALPLTQAFPADYGIALAWAGSEDYFDYYAFDEGLLGAQGEVLRLLVSPYDQPPWVGSFHAGYGSSNAWTGAVTLPDRDLMLVVAQGQGYTISVRNPKDSIPIREVFPIMHVHPIIEAERVILGDFTTLAAHGPGGIVWRSRRLSWDGIELTSVSKECIRGLAWSAPERSHVGFTVDPLTGEHSGGSSPASE